MLNKSVKRLSLFLICIYLFLVKLGYTDADIFAERIVSRNKLSAITLDFSTITSFSNNKILNLFHSTSLQPNGFDLGAIRIKGQSNSDFKYHIQAVKINGDDVFCNKLKLEVFNRHFNRKFNGSLLSLNINSDIADNNLTDWIFMLSLDDNSPELKNKICEFNFDIRTYRNYPDEKNGIFAQRLVSNIVSSGNW